jgi:hypothetical protein
MTRVEASTSYLALEAAKRFSVKRLMFNSAFEGKNNPFSLFYNFK